MKSTRSVAGLAALVGLLATVGVLLLAAAPAGAHGGEGEAEITSITRSGDDVTVTVRLVYVADGHGVPDATVTVVVGDGTPVPMEPGAEEGDYQATVPAEAGATVRVTSVEPETSVEGTAPAADETTTTATPDDSTTTAAETTTETAATDGGPTTPTNEEGEAVPGPNGIDEAPEDETGNLIVIAVLAVVVVAALVAAVLLRRKPPALDEPPASGGGPRDGASS